MPNRAKGSRLYLRNEAGRPPVWIIRDGSNRVSTGCTALERELAGERLRAYLATKHKPDRERGKDPHSVPVADVLNIYVTERLGSIASPGALKSRIRFLAGFFGRMTLAEINGAVCRAYVESRGSEQAARRELEDLRAAIRHHWREGLCDREIAVALPPKAQPRERWLTRAEAAHLIWAAWRYRQTQGGVPTDRHMRRHIARFILVGLYTGTRAGAICSASLVPAVGRGHVDLDAGVFKRLPQGKRETSKRQPTIRIPDRLLAHMRRWRDKGISKSAVIEFDGRPIGSVKKAFAHLVDEVGLKGVTQHTLRHTAVTWAMQRGADPYRAAGFFGMSIQIIQRVYGHHHPDYQRDIGDAVTGRGARERNGHRGAGSGQVRENKQRKSAPNATNDINNIR
jgi:integrase